MNTNKVCTQITDEIINEFRLPRSVCYDFIWGRANILISIGFNLGRSSHHPSKPVVSLNKEGKIVKVYLSLKEAANDVDGCSSYISKICLERTISRRKSDGTTRIYKPKIHKGYGWKFVDPDNYYMYRKLNNTES